MLFKSESGTLLIENGNFVSDDATPSADEVLMMLGRFISNRIRLEQQAKAIGNDKTREDELLKLMDEIDSEHKAVNQLLGAAECCAAPTEPKTKGK